MDDPIAADDDFGHIVHRTPHSVVRPRTTEDVVAAVRQARELGLPLVPRGRGHSTFGQAQTAGVLLDTRDLNAITVHGDTVTTGAGASWRQVLHATLPAATPPVLTDYLDLAVGGTLSVGGIGGTSHRYGLQTDQVVALEIVTPDGTVRTGGPGDPALAAFGRAGIITRATLRLVPAPARVHWRKIDLPTVTDVLARQRELIGDGRFDHVQGHVVPGENGWRCVLEVASYQGETDLPYREFADRLTPGETVLRSTGEWWHPHPWWNGFLPDHAADDFVTELLAELTAADLGAGGLVLVYPIHTRHLTTPAFRVPATPIVFLVAVLRTSPPDDPDAIAAALTANRMWHARATAAGGTTYPISAL